MINHLQVAVQVAKMPLSKITQNVLFRNARLINRENRRIAHLFQGSYKAIVGDADSDPLELVRHMHLNPLRAALITDPRHYFWSP